MNRLAALLVLIGAGAIGAAACGAEASGDAAALPPASAEKLPRWRGFNLLEKFHKQWSNRPFVEEDFRLIHELGFNFVRLPMDYRTWIVGDDWERFDEKTLAEIDRAVALGGKYGIHVCINFHRAPGYTVASPPEAKSLWTDAEAQRVCALHWAAFARRYKGVPSEQLSFNLFNEPADIAPAVYVRAVRGIVAAIRKEDPHRLIISDGLKWGGVPIPELKELKLAQATRGYAPMEISHYKASWVQGADNYPVPTWPILTGVGMLYGSGKRELQVPMTIDGPFSQPSQLRIRVGTVSGRCLMLVDADGKTVLEKDFVCGPGQGEWKRAEYRAQWKIYQNTYDRDYEAAIPAGTRRIRIRATDGDWMTLRELGIKSQGASAESVLQLRDTWGQKPSQFRYRLADSGPMLDSADRLDRAWLQATMVEPWKKAQAQGIGVMVGEFGAFNCTPHAVTLAWMEDCLKNWHEAGWGWALWNFRGSFGVLDSDRKDVAYENFHGHKLDRKMLDLLKKY